MNWKSNIETYTAAAAAAKSLPSCLTLCDPIDGSPPGSDISGILQARTLEWVAIAFSNAWKWSHSVGPTLCDPHGLQPPRLLRPWDFPGKSTGVGCHFLLQKHTHYHLKSITSVWCRELKSGALWQHRGVGWGRRWEGGSRGKGHMYSWFMFMYGRN